METVKSVANNVESLTWHRLNRNQDLGPRLLDLATDHYGELGVYESWDEFWCFADDPPLFCLESPAFSCYAHFFIYHWVPDEDSDVHARANNQKTFGSLVNEQRDFGFDPFEYEIISAGCHSQFTFYEVLSFEPQVKIVVRDIMRGRTYSVTERFPAGQFVVGDVIYGRLITISDSTIFYPILPLVFSPQSKVEVRNLKRELFGARRTILASDLYQHDFEIRELCQALAGHVLF